MEIAKNCALAMHQVNSSQSLFSGFLALEMPGENRRRPKSSQSFHELAQKLQYDIFISRGLALVHLQQRSGKVKKTGASKQPAELFGLHLVELSISVEVPP